MRITAFIVLLFFGSLLPMYVLMACGLVYVFLWEGYELLILAALFDAFFGSATIVPYCTLLVGGALVLSESIKPYLSFYNEQK